MAAASSSPELFINVIGTFVTEGDLGVGTIVGSAVFNILAVPACCALFANQVNTEARFDAILSYFSIINDHLWHPYRYLILGVELGVVARVTWYVSVRLHSCPSDIDSSRRTCRVVRGAYPGLLLHSLHIRWYICRINWTKISYSNKFVIHSERNRTLCALAWKKLIALILGKLSSKFENI